MIVAVAAIVSAAFVAAIVASPGFLGSLGTPPNTPDQETPAVERPTWTVGDRWTYNVSLSESLREASITSSGVPLTGVVTQEVTSVADGAYNVSVLVTASGAIATTMDGLLEVEVTEASLDGYTLYRQLDLARLRDVRTAHVEMDAMTLMGPVHGRLTLTAIATFQPAWDAWAFPIEETDGWVVRTDATVEIRSLLRLESASGHLEIGRNASFTVPLNYSLTSVGLEEVVTPAGTFAAMHAFATLPEVDLGLGDEVALILALGGDPVGVPNVALDIWFGESVGNVVRATASAGLARTATLEVVLVAYRNA
ncbi:MAG: hypothetical protein ACT4OI_03880 [Methanobacteriota archaeon]